MTDNTDVVVKEPFKSGNSKVITITGLPFIPSDKEVVIKAVEIDGVKGCLMLPHQEMYKYDLIDKPQHIEFKDEEGDVQ